MGTRLSGDGLPLLRPGRAVRHVHKLCIGPDKDDRHVARWPVPLLSDNQPHFDSLGRSASSSGSSEVFFSRKMKMTTSASCSMIPTHEGPKAAGAGAGPLFGGAAQLRKRQDRNLSSLAMLFRLREM